MTLRIAFGLVIAAVVIVITSILVTQGASEESKGPLSEPPSKTLYAPHSSKAPPRASGIANGATLRSNDSEPVVPAKVVPDRQLVLASIHEAAITYDSAALSDIVPHLGSPDPEVRAAAVEGVLLLGDSTGALFLREAARKVRDPAEAADLIAKAEYLELPPAKLMRKQ